MNANERFEYMAEQFYKKTGMLAPGKDDAIPRSEEYKLKATCDWVVFREKFYSNLFRTHTEMYELLEDLKEINVPPEYLDENELNALYKIDELLKKARGEKC